MDWWHKMRRGWLAVSSRVRSHKSGNGRGSSGRGGSRGGGGSVANSGLLILRDEVQMCSYKDVHVMWNMLTGIDTDSPPPKPTTKKRRSYWSWRVPFWWSNHKLAPSFSSPLS